MQSLKPRSGGDQGGTKAGEGGESSCIELGRRSKGWKNPGVCAFAGAWSVYVVSLLSGRSLR